MPKKIPPEDDEWFGVEDTKKRKQIQDRLAQRARRMRLAKSKGHPTRSPSSSENPSPNLCQNLISVQSTRTPPPNASHLPLSPDVLASLSPELTLGLDHTQLTLSIFTLHAALYAHGIILGIPCVTAGVHISRPAGPHVPLPLRPIQLQLDEVHYTFIDRIPNKDLRRNMIALSDSFSAEEFVADSFHMRSFVLESGTESWDPSGWKVDAAFRRKWNLLFKGVDIGIV